MELTDQIRQILRGRGLSLSRVSSESAKVFGLRSPFYISEKMYFEIATLGHWPSIHQLVSFSRITGYSLADWLRIFDIDLDNIPRLQLALPRKNTVLLDASVYEEDIWVPWFIERPQITQRRNITPLGQIWAYGPNMQMEMLRAAGNREFAYVRVGEDDAYAFPEIAPGSLVRANREAAASALSLVGSACSRQVFLVENGPKLHCGHLRRDRNGRLTLCSKYFPFSHIESGSEQRLSVVGVVDAELRIVRDPRVPSPASHFPEAEKLQEAAAPATPLNKLIRGARQRTGLSLQCASVMSRSIASQLGNPRYFAASGTLSHYENHPAAPRGIHKIVSLCILYSIGFGEFLEAAQVSLKTLGSQRIPEIHQNAQTSLADKPKAGSDRGVLLADLLGRWHEIPWFLRRSLDAVSGLKHLSLSDVYWVQDDPDPIHPLLVNAAFIAVNRRIKKPPRPDRRTLWEHPLYLVLKRDGNYLCGCCTLQRRTISIYPRPFSNQRTLQLKNGIDAEVIGQVTAILRRTV
jgi:hypothetical protein